MTTPTQDRGPSTGWRRIAAPTSLSRRDVLAYGAVALLLAIVAGLLPALQVWPDRPFPLAHRELHEGRVIGTLSRQVTTTPTGDFVSERLAVDLDGQRVEADRLFQTGTAAGFEARPGDPILLYRTETTLGTSYQVADRGRQSAIWIISLAFALVVLAVGGWQGMWSLLGLAASVLVIVRFIVPAVLSGADPLVICITGAIVIMAATLTLGHGAGRKTAIALAATSASLVLAGLAATWAVDLVTLSGLAGENETLLHRFAGTSIDMRGLLLGGIILGAVGVLDDVTTTQASTVIELHEADPTLGRRELFRRAMRVGRDHIAATTNTLLLAYAGTALPLLVLLAGSGLSAQMAVSFETLATEVVRTVAGSMAIVAAVPVSSALAALVVTRTPRTRADS